MAFPRLSILRERPAGGREGRSRLLRIRTPRFFVISTVSPIGAGFSRVQLRHGRECDNVAAMKNFPSVKLSATPMALLLSTMQLAAAPSDATRPAKALGPANAPATIEFFSDLQCPQCARYEPIVKSLKTEFGDQVRIVLRQFPLNTHEQAVLAACVAEAAANQGKFWQMAEALYKTQWMWASAPAPRTILMDQAKNLGLDLDQFQKDLDGTECSEQIDADGAYGLALGVKTAPSVLINGFNVPNTEFNENGFRAAIKAPLPKTAQ